MTPFVLRARNRARGAARLAAVLALGSIVLTTSGPAMAEPTETSSAVTGRAYLFRGLIGLVFSRGMDRLGERIRSAGVSAVVAGFTSCDSVAATAIREYRRDPMPITLIGHSMGGRCVLRLAEVLRGKNIPTSLVVTFDPPRISPHIPFNVERYINIFKSTDLLGAGDVLYRQGFPGHYASFDLLEQGGIVHINIEKIESLHEQLVAKIVQLATTPAGTEGEILPIRYKVPANAPIELWDSGRSVFAQAGDTLRTLATAHRVPIWALTQMNKVPDNVPLARGDRVTVPRYLVPPPPPATGAGKKTGSSKR
jgi:hypothetical protein